MTTILLIILAIVVIDVTKDVVLVKYFPNSKWTNMEKEFARKVAEKILRR